MLSPIAVNWSEIYSPSMLSKELLIESILLAKFNELSDRGPRVLNIANGSGPISSIEWDNTTIFLMNGVTCSPKASNCSPAVLRLCELVTKLSKAYATSNNGCTSISLNAPAKFLILSIGLSAPNSEPMPSLSPLINAPPLSADIPAAIDAIAGPTNLRFSASTILK